VVAFGHQLFYDEIQGVAVAPGYVLLFGQVSSILNEEGTCCCREMICAHQITKLHRAQNSQDTRCQLDDLEHECDCGGNMMIYWLAECTSKLE
jgi:hypothetical protein